MLPGGSRYWEDTGLEVELWPQSPGTKTRSGGFLCGPAVYGSSIVTAAAGVCSGSGLTLDRELPYASTAVGKTHKQKTVENPTE